MPAKRRRAAPKAKKSAKKPRQLGTRKANHLRKRAEPEKPLPSIILPARGAARPILEIARITLENIRGDTTIGDLLVIFPRIRDVLAVRGLRLEAEDAGDIFLTLEAFSAMNGLKPESLIRDVVEAAREPPPHQPATELIPPPPA